MLEMQPATGYDLTRRFEASLSNAWYASHSQIYPELGRLQEEGLIEVVGEGARRSRTYAATDEGRAELRHWLLETEPNRQQRNETAVRWFLVALLDAEDRRKIYERELVHADRFRATLQERADELDALDHPHPFRATVDLGLRTTAVMREWLQEQLAQST
jgi:DNA-binding PadR family transcriptional regulator